MLSNIADMQPIKVWTTSSGPNGWKPVIILEELGLPYDLVKMPFDQLVGPEFRSLTPVGKVPLMHDPNTDIQIFESGAIMLYLIETYDHAHVLTYTTPKEKALQNQWLMYQVSQQGPFYGQIGWFMTLHSERIESCIKRYTDQAHIILSVLEKTLASSSTTEASSGSWLVGSKVTYADLSFFSWNEILPLAMQIMDGTTPLTQYPNVMAWHERMKEMKGVKRAWEIRTEMMRQEKVDATGLPEGKTFKGMAGQMDEVAKQVNGAGS